MTIERNDQTMEAILLRMTSGERSIEIRPVIDRNTKLITSAEIVPV